MTVNFILRPVCQDDLPLLNVVDSEFDDYGQPPREEPHHPGFDEHVGGLAVVDAATDELFGSVSWVWQQWGPTAESRCLMIGISLRAEHRGKGLGSAAQRALVEHLFASTQINRVEAHTDVTNIAEQRALERAGFTQEGIVRGAHWRAGAHHDGYLYSILRADIAGAQAT